MLHWSHQNFHQHNVIFSGNTHLCFLPTPCLHVQTKWEFNCCCASEHIWFEIKKQFIFSHNFLSFLLSLCTLTILWYVLWPFSIPTPIPCSDKWLMMQVISDCKFHVLICVSLAFLSAVKWTDKQFYFIFWSWCDMTDQKFNTPWKSLCYCCFVNLL